eukprot:403373981
MNSEGVIFQGASVASRELVKSLQDQKELLAQIDTKIYEFQRQMVIADPQQQAFLHQQLQLAFLDKAKYEKEILQFKRAHTIQNFRGIKTPVENYCQQCDDFVITKTKWGGSDCQRNTSQVCLNIPCCCCCGIIPYLFCCFFTVRHYCPKDRTDFGASANNK